MGAKVQKIYLFAYICLKKIHRNIIATLVQCCSNIFYRPLHREKNNNYKTMKKNLIVAAVMACVAMSAMAQDVDLTPKIGGTIRSKYEYQTEEGEGRFEVRNARINITGKVTPIVSYKAEIDLCDEGAIKMLDAYTRLKPSKDWQFTIGQMRVPFTIDAHRSPHQQYFANRSFIAKQVGNVRDVGAAVGYNVNVGFPIILEAGLFNGSGLTNQKDYWTKGTNYSAKAQFLLPCGLNVVGSIQKVKPSDVTVTMYDGGLTFHHKQLLIEAEYLYKQYSKDAFEGVHAFDGFINYDFLLKKGPLQKISALARYDFMSNHSDGKRYENSNGESVLKVNDYKRSRITSGITLSFAKPFISDVRINFEKYFYAKNSIAKPSEKDKIVIEFMTKF